MAKRRVTKQAVKDNNEDIYLNKSTGRPVKVVWRSKGILRHSVGVGSHLRYVGMLAEYSEALERTIYVVDPKAKPYRIGVERFAERFEPTAWFVVAS